MLSEVNVHKSHLKTAVSPVRTKIYLDHEPQNNDFMFQR